MDAVIKVEYGDKLICDPGYIKSVWTEWCDKKEPRFDLIRCEKVLHDGDDGCYDIEYNGETRALGVDSGRIWLMNIEFGGYIELSAGISGFWHIPAGELL